MATFANTSNPTPFSAFDSDTDFQTEADSMFTFVKRKLGDDILSVELTKKQVWACFEESVFEFGKFVNEYMTKSQLSNMLGGSTGSMSGSEGRFPRETLEFLMRKAEPYATHAAIGGSHNVISGSLLMSASKQDYDIYDELVNASGTRIFDTQTHKSKMRIFEVYHFNPQAAYRFFDTTSAINYLNNEFSFESFTPETVFYVLPVFEDVLRAGQMDISNRVRRSNFSYQLIGTKLRLFPRPTEASDDKKLWLRVGFVNDGLSTPFEDATMDGISSPHNLPYGNIDFSNINSMGRQWIRQYTLGCCKEVLGLVRSKFSSIPIPNGDLQLNGGDLISAGKEEKERLRTELREMFDSLTYDKLIEAQATEATNITTILKTVPIPLGKCITVG
ncbi:MAG: hypothetical protein HN621_05615 [Porticoccaceae bacterium]|jgi:hypothetical protein|nr:hypothetical protein [Porticoccaceae bacterium]